MLDSSGASRRELVQVKPGEHGSVLDQIAMQLETTCQIVADVARTRPFDITMEVVAVGRVGTAVDQATRAFCGYQAAKVGHSLFRDHDMHGMLAVVRVATEGNDRGDSPPLGDRGTDKHRKVCIPLEVPGTADCIHHLRAAHMK